jgi:hypothetical protein
MFGIFFQMQLLKKNWKQMQISHWRLAFAVREGDLEKMKILVEEKNANIEDGFALFIAIKERNFEAMKYLLEAGGKLYSETKEAARIGILGGVRDEGNWKLQKFLVKLGAVPDNEYSCLKKDKRRC